MEGRLTRSTPGWVGGLNTRDACRPIVYHMAYGSYSTVQYTYKYSIRKRALLTLGAPLYHATKCTRQSICTRCSTVRYSTVQYSTAHGFCMFRCLVLPILHSVKVSTAVFFMYTTVATYCVWSNAICYAYPQHIFWLQYMCDVAYSLLILQTIEDGYGELEGIDLKQLA